MVFYNKARQQTIDGNPFAIDLLPNFWNFRLDFNKNIPNSGMTKSLNGITYTYYTISAHVLDTVQPLKTF